MPCSCARTIYQDACATQHPIGRPKGGSSVKSDRASTRFGVLFIVGRRRCPGLALSSHLSMLRITSRSCLSMKTGWRLARLTLIMGVALVGVPIVIYTPVRSFCGATDTGASSSRQFCAVVRSPAAARRQQREARREHQGDPDHEGQHFKNKLVAGHASALRRGHVTGVRLTRHQAAGLGQSATRYAVQARTDTERCPNESDCGDGSGCGNGRDDAGGAARALRSDKRCRR